jgi:hypothetical protein
VIKLLRKVAIIVLFAGVQAAPSWADDSGPCADPSAAGLADRPATGRNTSTGGAVCVVPKDALVVEAGVRDQTTTSSGADSSLVSYPLPLVRYGLAPRLEIAIAPPTQIVRSVSGAFAFAPAAGTTDSAISAKWLVADAPAFQASIGAGYVFPTGNVAFTNGAGSASFGVNAGFTLGPKISLTLSATMMNAFGSDPNGDTIPFFTFAPSLTLGYAIDAATTLLVQDALVSRTSPVGASGSRAFVALQHALGSRLAIDVEYERNLTPLPGTQAWAFGVGAVWLMRRPNAK